MVPYLYVPYRLWQLYEGFLTDRRSRRSDLDSVAAGSRNRRLGHQLSAGFIPNFPDSSSGTNHPQTDPTPPPPIPPSLFPLPYSPLPTPPLPIPYSLFPIPYSLFPIPYSLFPIPYSLFPIPYSLFPIPHPPLPPEVDPFPIPILLSLARALIHVPYACCGLAW